MNHSSTHLREVVSSVHQLKVTGPSITMANINDGTDCVRSRCSVQGHDWEIRFHPSLCVFGDRKDRYTPGLDLVFLGAESRMSSGSVTAFMSGKVISHSCDIFDPFKKKQKTVPKAFHRPMDRSLPIYLGVGRARDDDAVKNCWWTVECTVNVFREPEEIGDIPVPPSNLSWDIGGLLRSQAGADVTFVVSCQSFAAHKGVLAVRSPVFMAEFFGEMREKNSQCVEIKDIDAVVFKAMLHFIYTDEAPELNEKPEAATTALVQHLLVAADRYGLDRLKVMCERRLALGMDVSSVASTLALAEQHNCSRLKAKCIEFIAGGSSENLDAVLATEGFNHLVGSNPSVVAELLRSAHGKKRSRSPDA